MGDISEEVWKEYSLTHSRQIRNEIAENYIRLAKNVASRFASVAGEREDIEQVAYVALLHAVERFDALKKTAFSTYAVHVITGEIRHYIRDKIGIIHVNRSDKENLNQLLKVQEALMSRLSREPSIREIAAAMKLGIDDVVYLLQMRSSTDVISLQMSSDDSEDTIESFIGEVDSNFAQVENSQWFEWLLSTLTEQEKQLVQARFVEKKNQRETAKTMSVSQMYVSRMEKRLMERLRKQMNSSDIA